VSTESHSEKQATWRARGWMLGLVQSAVFLCCIVLQSRALRAHEGVGGAVDIVLRTLHTRTDSSRPIETARRIIGQSAGRVRQPNRRDWSAACMRWRA